MATAPAGAQVVAWSGAALFAVSLTYFLFSYAVTFGEIPAGGSAPRAIAIDLLLFSCFALHHSLFARERARRWMAAAAGPRLERSVYVWIASLMLIAVCAWWQPVPGVAWRASGALAWGLHGIQIAGVLMTLRSAAMIDIWELAGVRHASTPNSQSPPPNPESAAAGISSPFTPTPDWELGVGNWEFKTEGPYGWVRHPIYLGWFLIVFAVPAMTMTRLVFAVISSAYILLAIPLEERSLRRASHGRYDEYMHLVRWKVMPGLWSLVSCLWWR